jgi:hypothetical protein
MSPAQSNRYLLGFWSGAYAALGEDALPPLGLSPADIDAVLTVEPAVLHRWAEQPDSIVRPRPGLLSALQSDDRGQLEAFLGVSHDARSCTATARLPQAANRHLLALWQQAAGDDEAAERMALSSTDRAALTTADELALGRWMRLPIALAEPRPGLLPALLKREEPQLTAFLDSLGPRSATP